MVPTGLFLLRTGCRFEIQKLLVKLFSKSFESVPPFFQKGGTQKRSFSYRSGVAGGVSTISVARSRSTDSTRLTPRSCIVTPYSRSICAMVS
ncbi:hypothetical protein MSKU3_0806 [Komagataeibacter oboediens]|nr:hypothetical protein MSKU3_0806 [Komagataeibacter oboediens]